MFNSPIYSGIVIFHGIFMIVSFERREEIYTTPQNILTLLLINILILIMLLFVGLHSLVFLVIILLYEVCSFARKSKNSSF